MSSSSVAETKTNINLSVHHLHFFGDKNNIKYYFGVYEDKTMFYKWLNENFGIDENTFCVEDDGLNFIQIHVLDDSIFAMIRTYVNMLRDKG